MDAFNSFLPLVAEQFQPDVVAVSAGFDAHVYDLLLDLRVTKSSFYKIGQLLRERFDRMFATLEGGYNVEELPRCIHKASFGVWTFTPVLEVLGGGERGQRGQKGQRGDKGGHSAIIPLAPSATFAPFTPSTTFAPFIPSATFGPL